MQTRPEAVALVLAAAALLAPASVARAAVRICQPVVLVGPFEAPTEAEARRKVIEAWTREAAKYGKEFAGWGVAVNKELKCLPGEGGSSRCAARGEPCRIQQNPNRPVPRGRKPVET